MSDTREVKTRIQDIKYMPYSMMSDAINLYERSFHFKIIKRLSVISPVQKRRLDEWKQFKNLFYRGEVCIVIKYVK